MSTRYRLARIKCLQRIALESGEPALTYHALTRLREMARRDHSTSAVNAIWYISSEGDKELGRAAQHCLRELSAGY